MSDYSRKIHIPLEFREGDISGFTEIFLLVPYMNERAMELLSKAYGHWNDGLYSSLWLNPPAHQMVERIQDADYVILPFKFNPDDERVYRLSSQAAAHGKPIVAFYNDDNAATFDLPPNMILYRTSALKSKLTKQEKILPVLIPDHKPKTLELLHLQLPENKDIGFCGQVQHPRASILQEFYQYYLDGMVNIVQRSGFWAPEMSKLDGRRSYYEHLIKSSATLCMRGGGNFSYRLYEALSFGRIPVIINDDMSLPMQSFIGWDVIGPEINYNDLANDNGASIDKIDLNLYSPANNRLTWEKYLSPEGFVKHIFADIEA